MLVALKLESAARLREELKLAELHWELHRRHQVESRIANLVATRPELAPQLQRLLKNEQEHQKSKEENQRKLRRIRPQSREVDRIFGRPLPALRPRWTNKLDPMTLEEFLVKRKFKSEDFFLKDLPDYTKDSAGEWWEKVIKPYLESPQTLNLIRGTPFYYELSKLSKEELSQAALRVIMRSEGELVSDSFWNSPEGRQMLLGTETYNQVCTKRESPSKMKSILRELERRCERQVRNSLAPSVSRSRPPL